MPSNAQSISLQNTPASKPGMRTPGTRQPQKPQLGAQQTKFAQALNAAQATRRGPSASLAAIANQTGQAGLDAGLPGLGAGLPGVSNGLGAGVPIAEQLANIQALSQRTTPIRPAAAVPAAPVVVRPTLDLPGEFGAIVDQAARKYGVEPALIAAVMKTESNFNPDAVSKAGATTRSSW